MHWNKSRQLNQWKLCVKHEIKSYHQLKLRFTGNEWLRTIWQFLVNVNRNIIYFVMCTSYHIVIVLVFSHHYDAVLIAVIAGNLGRQRYLKYWTLSFSSVDFSTKIHCLLDVIFIALNCKNSVYIRDAWIRLFGVSLFQVLTMQTLLFLCKLTEVH